MKRTLLIFAALMLIAASLSGQGLKGKMLLTGYGGYSIGFGDAFDDFEAFGVKSSFGPNFNFGAMFHYGVSPKFLIGAELMLQNYKYEAEYSSAYDFTGFFKRADVEQFDYSVSESDMNTHILFNAMFAPSYKEEGGIYFLFGGGLYDDEFGANGGLAYLKQLSPNMNLYIAPRLHVIFASDMIMLLQASAGVQFAFGNK